MLSDRSLRVVREYSVSKIGLCGSLWLFVMELRRVLIARRKPDDIEDLPGQRASKDSKTWARHNFWDAKDWLTFAHWARQDREADGLLPRVHPKTVRVHHGASTYFSAFVDLRALQIKENIASLSGKIHRRNSFAVFRVYPFPRSFIESYNSVYPHMFRATGSISPSICPFTAVICLQRGQSASSQEAPTTRHLASTRPVALRFSSDRCLRRSSAAFGDDLRL